MSNEFFESAPREPLAREIHDIGQEERNGVLEVTGAETVTRLHFRKGSLVHAERAAGSDIWPLGDYLTFGGVLRPKDVAKALRAAEQKNIQAEEALLGMDGVTEDLLTRFIDLQLEESLFPLFNLQSPILTWLDERPKVVSLGTPLPTEWILKESRRRADIWPRLEDSVGRKTAIYDKDAGCLAELLGYTHDREEPLPSIGGNARIVFFYINGAKTVVQIARASGLGLFQVYQAIDELIDADVVEVVALRGEGEQPPIFRPYLRNALLVLTYAILALGLGLGVEWGLEHGNRLEEHLISHYGQELTESPAAEMTRLTASLELHELEFGHYPTSFTELVEVGYRLGNVDRLQEDYRLTLGSDGYKVMRNEDKE